jgi:nitronate monooxygenase
VPRVRTWLTERFGLQVPVVGAPMAGVAGGDLAGAVSAAGALGMVGVGPGAEPGWVRAQMQTAAASGASYGIGLLAWSLSERSEVLDAVLDQAGGESPPTLVSVSFGDLAPYVQPLRDAGVVVATQVGTVADAVAAEEAGVDLLVARGGEGGGHGRDLVATLPLLQAVLARTERPVLAAGGVGSARGLAAVLAAGAAGAWVGTAFLACREALTADAVTARLAEVDETGTAYGTVFDTASGAGWPAEFGGRAVRNDFFDTWHGREAALAGDAAARRRFRAARDAVDVDTMAVYAGQGAGLLGPGRPPAAAVVRDLAGAAGRLRDAAAAVVDE